MRIIITFLFLQISSLAFAQEANDAVSVQYDSSEVQRRTIPQEKLENFRADGDFDYGQEIAEGVSIWDRIRYWIFKLWQTIFGESVTGEIIEFAFYVLCLAGLVYVILRLLDVDATKLFYRREKEEGLKFQDALHDNIHSINFEEEITRALQEKDYRKAIRLRYLFALKELADRQVIRWQPGKTNAEYLQEVSSEYQSVLNDLSYYYMYTWYGNFSADEPLYRRVENMFYQLDKTRTAHA